VREEEGGERSGAGTVFGDERSEVSKGSAEQPPYIHNNYLHKNTFSKLAK
jgi:hypothetical protein